MFYFLNKLYYLFWFFYNRWETDQFTIFLIVIFLILFRQFTTELLSVKFAEKSDAYGVSREAAREYVYLFRSFLDHNIQNKAVVYHMLLSRNLKTSVKFY